MEKFSIENKIEKSGKEELKKTEETPEIKMPEIAELSEPVKKILSGLRENIDKGDYAAIFGDDASGRLPVLLFQRILSAIYKEKNLDRPKILFFAGREIWNPKLKEKISQDFRNFIEKTKVREMAENKKVLLVTDTISSGAHLHPFTEILKKMKINFDIATIGIFFRDNQGMLEKYLGGKIFWGMGGAPGIFKRHNLSGVEKRDDSSIFAKLPTRFKGDKEMAKKRFEARKDVEILAQKLIRWYRKESI